MKKESCYGQMTSEYGLSLTVITPQLSDQYNLATFLETDPSIPMSPSI